VPKLSTDLIANDEIYDDLNSANTILRIRAPNSLHLLQSR